MQYIGPCHIGPIKVQIAQIVHIVNIILYYLFATTI